MAQGFVASCTATATENIDRVQHIVIDTKQLAINQISYVITAYERIEIISHIELGLTEVSRSSDLHRKSTGRSNREKF